MYIIKTKNDEYRLNRKTLIRLSIVHYWNERVREVMKFSKCNAPNANLVIYGHASREQRSIMLLNSAQRDIVIVIDTVEE